ncbi:MAG TPA: DUF3089 domain-containing protein, partial [Rhizomicrobium sp.]|nr:DUF3089 domain-containing protein [Rhizomicrobium sp.]
MNRIHRRAALAAAALGAMLGIAADALAQSPPPGNDYSDAKNWLCLPGRAKDACSANEDATVAQADGTTTAEPFSADPKAKIDCFYVYPTVSYEKTGNADMAAGPEELSVVASQFARFTSVCRPYAPIYRQVTLAALASFLAGKPIPVNREMAYNDVRDAWNYYLAHDNHGRGVVLIGHSQGSGVLLQLIKNEIDGKPVQHKLVSAILMGTRLAVPAGKVVGGDFKSIPLCQAPGQTQCVITYASFRADAPPPADSRFGKVEGAGMIAACTNPASLVGGPGELHSYLTSSGSFGPNPLTAGPWVKGKTIDTPFVSVPGMLSAECVANSDASYLAISVHGDPAGPRIDKIAGDVVVGGKVQAQWGL